MQLPANCSAVKDQWLAAFREAVIRKVEEHCTTDDSMVHSTAATNKEGSITLVASREIMVSPLHNNAQCADAATMQRIESLNAQMLVMAERVKDVKQRVSGHFFSRFSPEISCQPPMFCGRCWDHLLRNWHLGWRRRELLENKTSIFQMNHLCQHQSQPKPFLN
jgi:hypothetical protein